MFHVISESVQQKTELDTDTHTSLPRSCRYNISDPYRRFIWQKCKIQDIYSFLLAHKDIFSFIVTVRIM